MENTYSHLTQISLSAKIPTHYNPKTSTSTAKYGPTGFYNTNSFINIVSDPTLSATLSNMANHSLTKKTWSSYKTAIEMLHQCLTETNNNISYPLSNNNIITFIAWLHKRNLSLSTDYSYLSAIRQAHLSLVLDSPTIRTTELRNIRVGCTYSFLTV